MMKKLIFIFAIIVIIFLSVVILILVINLKRYEDYGLRKICKENTYSPYTVKLDKERDNVIKVLVDKIGPMLDKKSYNYQTIKNILSSDYFDNEMYFIFKEIHQNDRKNLTYENMKRKLESGLNTGDIFKHKLSKNII